MAKAPTYPVLRWPDKERKWFLFRPGRFFLYLRFTTYCRTFLHSCTPWVFSFVWTVQIRVDKYSKLCILTGNLSLNHFTGVLYGVLEFSVLRHLKKDKCRRCTTHPTYSLHALTRQNWPLLYVMQYSTLNMVKNLYRVLFYRSWFIRKVRPKHIYRL